MSPARHRRQTCLGDRSGAGSSPDVATVLRGLLVRGTAREFERRQRHVELVGAGKLVLSLRAVREAELAAGDESLFTARLGGVELSISTLAGSPDARASTT